MIGIPDASTRAATYKRPQARLPLLERKRLLESIVPGDDLVRAGMYVRPPIATWIGSWRAQGFGGITFKEANSHYQPGTKSPEWASTTMPRR